MTKLPEAEVRQSQGASIREICKQLETTDQTYYSGAGSTVASSSTRRSGGRTSSRRMRS